MNECPSIIIDKVIPIIREETKRPNTLPIRTFNNNNKFTSLRWEGINTGINPLKFRVCPLGLIPAAIWGEPESLSDFSDNRIKDLTQEELEIFYDWWDSIKQEDAKEAMDLIWGKESIEESQVKAVNKALDIIHGESK